MSERVLEWVPRSHEGWQHPDGRATTIPVRGGQIGPPLFHRIVSQPGIDTETFTRLRWLCILSGKAVFGQVSMLC